MKESNCDSVVEEITSGLKDVAIPWFSRFILLPSVLKSLDVQYLTDFEERRKNSTARAGDASTDLLSYLESEFAPDRLAVLLRRYFKSIKELALAKEIERWEQSIFDGYPKEVSSIKDRPKLF